jgi:hypothetical protein
MTDAPEKSLYDSTIEKVFFRHYVAGIEEFVVKREELADTARELGLGPAKNLGDILYSYRFRRSLPEAILSTQNGGNVWSIRLAGDALYRFSLGPSPILHPNPHQARIKVPDTTPEIIKKYAKADEQALLAQIRYCRLLDIFLQIASYSLQSHLRTKVPQIGQIEIDEVYVGVDRRGAHFLVPLQAKGGKDKLSLLQTEQDIAYCAQQFPELECRPVSAQFMPDRTVALFELGAQGGKVVQIREAHYALVPHGEISPEDLRRYKASAD